MVNAITIERKILPKTPKETLPDLVLDTTALSNVKIINAQNGAKKYERISFFEIRYIAYPPEKKAKKEGIKTHVPIILYLRTSDGVH